MLDFSKIRTESLKEGCRWGCKKGYKEMGVWRLDNCPGSEPKEVWREPIGNVKRIERGEMKITLSGKVCSSFDYYILTFVTCLPFIFIVSFSDLSIVCDFGFWSDTAVPRL